jgi:hypothetical protein
MKKPYEEMKVNHVGAVSQVVAKSGNYMDCSKNFESKTFDAGSGQETQCN